LAPDSGLWFIDELVVWAADVELIVLLFHV
jgi:hypothetical protein